ncbi:putative ABC transporter permease protein [Frankia canadensis]|uniref:Putative ABC transporter permease protein n=1 Tax=Frankia canadensis TaxID=1836972 RepID=A0A2I2KQX8_9ACTN|nr:ABC transporter permease subunit [Frankia canadensis]SNQ48046.1 putative ABC transporter permease protein [Frankia canadensis]SOU55336.1 putative ABC transporter permease protein [Frankia canadensis]
MTTTSPAAATTDPPAPALPEPAPASRPRGRVRAASGGRRGNLASLVLGPAAVLAAFIGLWYGVSDGLLNEQQRFMLPPPHEVVRVGILDGKNFSSMMSALRLTCEVTFSGLAIAIVVGVIVAVAMSQAKWIENALFPWAVVIQTVPVLALTPVLSFFFGFALTSRIIVCVIIAFFPIVSNTLFGLQSVDRGMHELFRLHRTGRWTRLWKLQLPAALPSMFTGFRNAAGLSVIGAIVGEFFFKQGEPGLGTTLSVFTSRLEGERLWATTLTASLLGIAVFVFFGWLSRRVVGRWYQPKRG